MAACSIVVMDKKVRVFGYAKAASVSKKHTIPEAKKVKILRSRLSKKLLWPDGVLIIKAVERQVATIAQCI